MADDAAAKAGKQWDKLESIFEERTAKAMKRLGVPSAKDVEALKERIERCRRRSRRSARSAARKTRGQDRRAFRRREDRQARAQGRCLIGIQRTKQEDAAASSLHWKVSACTGPERTRAGRPS